MRLVLELAIIAIVVLAALMIKGILTNMEDDAFDAELTAAANERARYIHMTPVPERN